MYMDELDLKDLFNMFWVRKLQIILIVAILVVVGFIYSYILLVPQYQSTTSILLAKSNTSQGDTTSSTITSTDLTLNQKLISTYSALLKSESVLTEVINNLGIDKTVNQLENSITVSAKEDTEIIEIRVADQDAQLAQRIANEVAQVFITKIAQEYYNMDNVYIVDEAKVETVPYNINHVKDLVIFAAVGLVIAIVYVLIANMLDTTVKSKEDIEHKLGLTVLSSIPLCDFKTTVKGGKK